VLVAGYLGVGEVPSHLPEPVSHLVFGGAPFAQVPIKLSHHFGRPQRTVDAALADRQQRVAQVGLEQDARVDEDGKR